MRPKTQGMKGGEAGGHAQMRSPATACAEWKETGREIRQARRRSKARNLKTTIEEIERRIRVKRND